MEKRFLDQIKRRTWRSPFSEGLPSRWAGSCTQRQYRKIYWAVKDGLTYLNENNKKKWRPFEADSSLWGHYMWMEQWQLPHKFYRTARHHASPGTDCSKSPGCLCVPPCYIYFLRREALPSHHHAPVQVQSSTRRVPAFPLTGETPQRSEENFPKAIHPITSQLLKELPRHLIPALTVVCETQTTEV